MLDVEFIQRKINLIREDLIKLENFKGVTFDELSKDWLKWNALEHTKTFSKNQCSFIRTKSELVKTINNVISKTHIHEI